MTMIRLIKAIIVLGLIWSGYWYVAGASLRAGLTSWFETQADRGWQADFADLSTSGYPLRHITLLTNPALADPATGTAWRADWLQLDNPAIWPGKQTVIFADTPQSLSYLDQTVRLSAQGMRADLHLKPGLALELERMALLSGPWAITGDQGPLLQAQALTASMIQTDTPLTYQIDMDAAGFTPGAGLRGPGSATRALPPSFETLTLDMEVAFDRAWDRSALEDRRPQPTAIDLTLAEVHWGALRLLMAGAVTIDPQGVPTGSVTLKAENWRDMLDVAKTSGALPPHLVEPTERVLEVLAGIGGNRDALDVKLGLRGGYMTLGPLPIGPAPRLFLY